MKIFHLESIDKLEKETALALGFFDGVHLGHRKILEFTVKIARKENLAATLFTFQRHPIEVINPQLCFPYITTLDEKIFIAESMGLDYFIDSNFTEEFSRISPHNFIVKVLLEQLRGKIFIVGKDYHFGYMGAGNIEVLREITGKSGARIEVLPDIRFENVRIGSTDIRECILGGEIENANRYLGRWYSIEGKVLEGAGRGRKLGIPTANLNMDQYKVMPRPGVYCIFALVREDLYTGIGHVGDRPTFGEKQYNIEIHLFNFKDNLYGNIIRVFFTKYIRETIKFNHAEEMIKKIHEDINVCKNYVKTLRNEEIKQNVLFQSKIQPV